MTFKHVGGGGLLLQRLGRSLVPRPHLVKHPARFWIAITA